MQRAAIPSYEFFFLMLKWEFIDPLILNFWVWMQVKCMAFYVLKLFLELRSSWNSLCNHSVLFRDISVFRLLSFTWSHSCIRALISYVCPLLLYRMSIKRINQSGFGQQSAGFRYLRKGRSDSILFRFFWSFCLFRQFFFQRSIFSAVNAIVKLGRHVDLAAMCGGWIIHCSDHRNWNVWGLIYVLNIIFHLPRAVQCTYCGYSKMLLPIYI